MTLRSLPRPARALELTVDLTAIVVTGWLLATRAIAGPELARLGMLLVLAVAYNELSVRFAPLMRNIDRERLFASQSSIWAFTAVLTLPAGWPSLVIALAYGHALWQRRELAGSPYRVVLKAATMMLAAAAASAVLAVTGRVGRLPNDLATLGTVGCALAAYLVVNAGMTVLGRRLGGTPGDRSMGQLAVLDLGALSIAIAPAQCLLHGYWLMPLAVLVPCVLYLGSTVQQFAREARTDAKTGLLAAAAWTDRARELCRRRAAVSVLLLDLDHFKAINDTFGHLVGDQVLAAVGQVLRRELRSHDQLGRFGGEEFVVVLVGLGADDANLIATRLREAIGAIRVAAGGEQVGVTVSIGLAHSVRDHDLSALLAQADTALYVAKRDGRDRVAQAPVG